MRIQHCVSGNSKWLQSKFLVVRVARKPRQMEEEQEKEMEFREGGGQDVKDARMTPTSLSWWRFYRCFSTEHMINSEFILGATEARCT